MAARQRMVTLVVAALLLTGCGSASGGRPDPAPSTSAAPSPSPTDRSPHGVLLSAQLAMENARRARYSYRIGADGGAGMLFWAPKTVLQLKHQDETEQLIVLDTTAYRGSGRHWEKYSRHEVPYTGLIDRLNPVVALGAAVAGESPVLVGEEKLEDVTVQHYRASLSVEAYVAAQTQLNPARRQALQAELGKGGTSRLTLDLWLNDKDQLVRLHRSSANGTARLDDTITYSEFGGALSVQAPPEGDTVDAGAKTLPPEAA